MSITQTNTIAKIAAVVAGLGLVAMTFVAAAPAKAADTMFNTNLTMGSKGADVTALQNWLIGKGFSIAAGATGYFGGQTKAALASYQSANGITPAVGYFGPKTRAAVNAGGSTSTTGGVSTTGLTGGAGRLTNFSTQGDIISDVREADMGDKVLGFSADARGSDIAVSRLDVSFDLSGSSGSTNLNRYVTSVSVWQDGQKLGTMAATAGDYQNKVWTFRFSNLGGVIKNGTTGHIYVSVDAVTSINTLESGQTVKAYVATGALRANDAQGVSDTYISTQINQNFTVTAANKGKLTLTEATDDPAATTVKADLNNTTTGVTLLSFNAKATNQNVTLRSMPVGLNMVTGNLNDAIQTVALVSNGTTLSTKTVSSAAAYQEVVFDNLNLNIAKDSTQNFQVVTTVKKIDTTTFTSGDYLYATATVSAAWDAADAQGNAVNSANANLVGTVTGHNQTFQATGITVTKNSATTQTSVATQVGQGDNTQYSLGFKVTAGDADLYISRNIQRLASATTVPSASNGGVAWATTTSSTASSTDLGTSNLSAGDTNSSDTASVYKIPAGTSRNFTLNVTLTEKTPGSAGYTGVQLVGVNWSTTTSVTTSYYTSGLDQFKTADVSMTVH